jgi:hypothetical protein
MYIVFAFVQQPEVVHRDIKFARSLSMAKLKFPFPHMVAVVMREKSHGDLQLMSQGTADIILDSCVDYWDGHDLCPLSPADRYYHFPSMMQDNLVSNISTSDLMIGIYFLVRR